MSAVRLFSDFSPGSVDEGSARTLDNGAKIVFLNHGPDRMPLMLQTTPLRTIKGVEKNDFGDGPVKYTMELALAPDDVEYQKLKEFDERILELASTSKQKWIKSKSGAAYNHDMLKELYTPTLKIPRDKDGNVKDNWPPTFKVTIPQSRDNGSFDVEVWDSKKHKVKMEDFMNTSRNAYVTVIAKCTGIWVSGGKFGTSWKAQQILVMSSGRSNIESFAFINADKLLEEADDPSSAPPPALEGNRAPAAPQAADDDDEYLDDSD